MLNNIETFYLCFFYNWFILFSLTNYIFLLLIIYIIFVFGTVACFGKCCFFFSNCPFSYVSVSLSIRNSFDLFIQKFVLYLFPILIWLFLFHFSSTVAHPSELPPSPHQWDWQNSQRSHQQRSQPQNINKVLCDCVLWTNSCWSTLWNSNKHLHDNTFYLITTQNSILVNWEQW